MNVTQIFCDADDFCQEFIPNWRKTLVEDGETKIRISEVAWMELA
jgi:hypothetical protein